MSLHVQGPATRADLAVLPLSAQLVEGERHLAIHCNARPDFWFGNYIVLLEPPAGSLSEWLSIWLYEFPAATGVEKVVFQWEQREPTAVDVPDWMTLEVSDVLMFDRRTEISNAAPDLSIGRVTSDEEWLDVRRFYGSELYSDESDTAFSAWRVDEYRRLAESRGCGEWWHVRDEGRVVAAAGLFRIESMFCFQEVVTASAARRRGIAAALCSTMIAANESPGVSFLTVAAMDSEASRLYRRIGFQRVGYQTAMIGDRDALGNKGLLE